MYFNEHNPPHFQIEYQGLKATVTIEAGIVEGKMPNRALNLVFEWLELHRKELMANWMTIQKTGEYLSIEPLD